MPSRKRLWIAGYAASTLLLIVGVTVFIGSRRESTPSRSDSPKLAEMPFPATASVVGPDRTRIGSSVQIRAAGYGDKPVKSVSLYDGSTEVVRAQGDSGQGATLSFPGLSVGRHVLHAQVTDESGDTTYTAPVTVEVAPGPGTDPLPVPVSPLPEETPEHLAARLHVPLENLIVVDGPRPVSFDPEHQGNGPKPDAKKAFGAKAKVLVAVAPDAGLKGVTGGSKPIIKQSTVDLIKGQPTIEISSDGCALKLKISGEGKLQAQQLFGGLIGWNSLGSIDEKGEFELGEVAPGSYTYAVIDSKNRRTMADVTLPASCKEKLGWSGNASITNGVLNIPEAANVFVLMSVDSKPWERIPQIPDRLLAAGKTTDVSNQMPGLEGKHLELEVWKFQGDIPLKMASGTLNVPAGKSVSSITGGGKQISLRIVSSTITEDQPGSITFEWSSGDPQLNKVMFQLTNSQLPLSDNSLSPDGLVGAGISKGDAKGTFTLASKDVEAGSKSTPKVGAGGAAGAGLRVVKPAVTPASVSSLGQISYAKYIDPSSSAAGSLDVGSIGQTLPGPGDRVWVRVVAIPDGVAVSVASPQSSFDIPVPESASTSITFKVDSIDVDPGRAPNPGLGSCLYVTVPWKGRSPYSISDKLGPYFGLGGSNPPGPIWESGLPADSPVLFSAGVLSQFYPQSGTYCPSDFPPPKGCDSFICDIYEGVVSVVEQVGQLLSAIWDGIASVYNGVIDGIVKVISKLNPLCVALSAASDSAEKTCETVSGAIAKAAISAVLASVGLPPSLPTSEQLKAIASGEIGVLVVEFAKSYGVPCDELKASPEMASAIGVANKELGGPPQAGAVAENPCLAMANMLVSAISDQVKSSGSQSVASAVGLPFISGIDGFTVAPEPKGQRQPAKVSAKMSVLKSNADASGAVCWLRPKENKNYSAFHGKSSLLVEDEPIDGKGAWSSELVMMPNVSPTTLQGYVLSVRLHFETGPCRIEPTSSEPVTLAPALPR